MVKIAAIEKVAPSGNAPNALEVLTVQVDITALDILAFTKILKITITTTNGMITNGIQTITSAQWSRGVH